MFDLAAADLDAAQLLAQGQNRYAAYHVQQAVEKLIKAVILASGREAGTEHRLDVLMARLDPNDVWRHRLDPFVAYTPYATTFRYPTPGGRIPDAPPMGEITRDIQELRPILDEMRAKLRP